MRSKRGPGELEAEVLAALWAARRPLTPGEVRQELGDELAYTTVMTICRRLVDKGLLVREAVSSSRAYVYRPVMAQAEHAADQMHALFSAAGDRQEVLAGFLGRLSASDRRTLSSLLARRGRQPSGG